MTENPTVNWVRSREEPAAKERLLLIVSAAGEPPDAQLMYKSEIVIGYWTGEYYRRLSVDQSAWH